ncbi:type IV toxin-antitoxin system AbiEi family antitoxin domain-containing protein [Tsukamurella spumae]|uniref:Type IV toxin-antitoxin system AbiEi family antitoxin domain-containing protein n=1 Tax=Tsukamurella spumae TaxID=44753 RepID=A0A846WWR3_9ACTN|nr:type IV toxin-antitoxin system AbiEi family antitoxin domain-containing protein [Tsukamurella spumae]NKY17284.1 type IV toxin-antitoxin system AbiEi family antitoxin domain-containing protein [Tsukamurella spumae]
MGEILTREYLLATGWTSGDISRAVASGELIRLAMGVYAHAGGYDARTLYRMKILAASMSCGGVVSHESAAVLHDIPFLQPDRQSVHFTVDREHGGGRRPGIHVHPRPLEDDEVVEVDGVRVTSRVRTPIDVAMSGDLVRAVAAIDAVRFIPRFPTASTPAPVPLESLQCTLDRLGRRRGSAVARRALHLSVDCSESAGESWSRMLMLAWGVPTPQLQAEFHLDGHLLFADFRWGTLIGEFDGEGKYGTTDSERSAALAAEKQRHAVFAAHGFEIVRWGWKDLVDDARLRRKLTPTLVRHGLLAA